MKTNYLLIVSLAVALIIGTPFVAQASIVLPDDIIYETWASGTYVNYPFLVRLNAHTQQVSLFYARAQSAVHPASWSPKGDMLAILMSNWQTNDPNVYHVCILSRAGTLLTCMQDSIEGTIDIGIPQAEYLNYRTITWSNDEKTLYYVTSQDSVSHFIEADVATGKSVRVLYDNPDIDPDSAAPAPNGSALLLNRGGLYADINTPNLVQISADGSAVHLKVNALLAPPKNNMVQSINSDLAHKRIFCAFSPKGTYFTAYDSAASPGESIMPYEFDIFDINGHIQYQLKADSNAIMPYNECPAWTSDESAIFFRNYVADTTGNYSATIYKYTLRTRKVEPYFSIPGVLGIFSSPFSVSPDGVYLFYEAGAADGGLAIATVVGPNNTVMTYPAPFSSKISKHPLWVPPLQP